jgi:hypothetical protein
MDCKYYDCGWCYAPSEISTSATPHKECLNPDACLYLKSQMNTQKDLECEMEELRLEIKDNAERIDKLCDILKRNNEKLRTLKQMNTNEAVENKLLNKNWNVQVMNANYPMLEVVDENTVKVEGVEYKKVEKEKPQTLYDALLDDFDIQDSEIICDNVSRWLPAERYEDGQDYNIGWNDCIKHLKEKLK